MLGAVCKRTAVVCSHCPGTPQSPQRLPATKPRHRVLNQGRRFLVLAGRALAPAAGAGWIVTRTTSSMVTDSLAGLLETSASRAPTAPVDGEGELAQKPLLCPQHWCAVAIVVDADVGCQYFGRRLPAPRCKAADTMLSHQSFCDQHLCAVRSFDAAAQHRWVQAARRQSAARLDASP